MKINPHLSTPLSWGILSLLIFFSTLSHQASFSPPPSIQNPRLQNAYCALQAWKETITSDPKGFTTNWCGPDVCNYTGVYCSPAPDDPSVITVAGIDLNHAGISGTLPEDLGLLTDLTLFHINSNYFCGTIPQSFKKLRLLFELDVSNNRLSGVFPYVVLKLPSLKFLDIRFNMFEGEIPSSLFDLRLDALFVNNNKFKSSLPKNFGNSPVSVVVLANNQINGCLPPSIGKMAGTLNQILLLNVGLNGCLPTEIGLLKEVTVFDVSNNMLVGTLPESIGQMKSLEQLNVAHNKLTGAIPASICSLPKLENFTYSYNYFCSEPGICLKLPAKDDRENCIPDRPEQRSAAECKAAYSHPVDCGAFGCTPRSPPPPSPPPPSPPPPSPPPPCDEAPPLPPSPPPY
ncbi:hypothetical protein Vadar_020846 [Vaccinium darrowii]|uniref:Uncharacterized protein n=1 Tax=Vaccinium darrowii TaxID=229202 RepID=A0ACB7XS05_9ERIC|nr:hypothetical protein Vadar_020846 [Vaccinium darrowii]